MAELGTYRRRGSVDVFRYNSYNEIMRKIATPPVHPKNRETWERDFNGMGGTEDGEMLAIRWIGKECAAAIAKKKQRRNVQSVTEWLREGWPEGVKRIHDELGHLDLPEMTDIRRRCRWSSEGDTLSVERLYGGDMDTCWLTYSRGTVKRPPPIHIFCDISVNCSSDALFWRGATQFAFVEAALAAGHRVKVEQVINIEGLSNSGSGFLAVTCVKDYDQSLNPSALAAISANCASMRLTDFGHCTQIPEYMTCYGGVASLNMDRIRNRGLLDPRAHTLLVPNHIFSRDDAVGWLKTACEDLHKRIATGDWNDNEKTSGLVSPARAEWEV